MKILDDKSKQHEGEVAVDRLRGRRVREWGVADRRLELDTAGVIPEEGEVGGESGVVGKKASDSDCLTISAPPLGNARGDSILQPQQTIVDRPHDQRRRRDDLR